MSTDEVKKAIIARFAHEANRLWCLLLGDESQTTWEHAEPWQKDSAFKGVDESAWRNHWFYLQSYSNQGLANDNEVVIHGTARAVAQALATHDMATGKPPRSIVEFGKALKELLAIPEKPESPFYADQSKGMEALVAKMLPVIKNELYERGNAATCLPEDRQVAWALMKGLQAISDVLNVPKALMSQQDAAVSVSK